MFIDMHCHSVSSDDSRATAEQYLKWIVVQRKKGHQIDGIVLTEHRKYDADLDYSELAEQYSVVILKGSELDTRYGHFLVYGVNQRLLDLFDFANVKLDPLALMREAELSGGFAIPAHPGRHGIGLVEFLNNGQDFSGITVVEELNASNRPGEGERAAELIRDRGLLGTGGSDAHFTSAIAKCLTYFPYDIKTEDQLVQGLREGGFHAVNLEETTQPTG